MGRKFGITQVSRLKHADIYKAAKKMGSIKKLAEHLGLHHTTVHEWCNLKRTPTTKWTDERKLDIETKLFELTGKTLEELFPPELVENQAFLRAPKLLEQTKDIEISALLNYAGASTERLTYIPPEDTEELDVIKEELLSLIKTFPERTQCILEIRFGLEGGRQLSYTELAECFERTKELMRGIEQKALRKLAEMASPRLREYITSRYGSKLVIQEAETDIWPSQKMERQQKRKSVLLLLEPEAVEVYPKLCNVYMAASRRQKVADLFGFRSLRHVCYYRPKHETRPGWQQGHPLYLQSTECYPTGTLMLYQILDQLAEAEALLYPSRTRNEEEELAEEERRRQSAYGVQRIS
jgi:hypothetical protein